VGSGIDTIRVDGARLRVGPWRGDARIAYLAPVGEGPGPGVDAIRACCATLAARGYHDAITAALGPVEARSFLAAGFAVRERLHLLAHDLRHLPERPAAPLRRGRKRDHGVVLAVDAAAFTPFWRLDATGLEEALTATPSCRFRVVDDGAVRGYAVTGRAGQRGFLQRLAVDPPRQGTGYGRALVLDGLDWLRRRGADRVVVNTQESNGRALALYEALGFRRQPAGLAVLHLPL
jgi:ribosomal protein S18 acetylase RimI-like enzyme